MSDDEPKTAGIAAALSAAQGMMGHAVKDSTNPHYKNRYASLAACLDAIREPFAKHGLALVQLLSHGADGISLETRILHTSGEELSSFYPVRPQQDTPQGYGSALTYARRYALCAAVGIAADDDDGEAMNSQKRSVPIPSASDARPPSMHPQVKALLTAYEREGWGAPQVCSVLGVSSVTEIGAEHLAKARAHYASIKGVREPGEDG